VIAGEDDGDPLGVGELSDRRPNGSDDVGPATPSKGSISTSSGSMSPAPSSKTGASRDTTLRLASRSVSLMQILQTIV